MPCFPKIGIGTAFSETFERAFSINDGRFPSCSRGGTLAVLGDFSGQSHDSACETYTFLYVDIDKTDRFLLRQRDLRTRGGLGNRRLSFKNLSDQKRRDVLVRYLDNANELDGCVVSFAIPKLSGSIFQGGEDRSELLQAWKPKVHEHILRIVHLSAYLCAGFSNPGQDLLWIIDEDVAASNDAQLKDLTLVFSRVLGNCLTHNLRHVRCGTSRSEDETLLLEDLLSVSDLVSGAWGEMSNAFSEQKYSPRRKVVLPLPRRLSSKTLLISSWLSANHFPLRRELFQLVIPSDGGGPQLTHVRIKPIVEP